MAKKKMIWQEIKDKFNKDFEKYGVNQVLAKEKQSPLYQKLWAAIEKQSQKTKKPKKAVNE